MSELLAISDLHVGHAENFEAIKKITARPNDYLILGGDICERLVELEATLESLRPKFKELFWVPGNHELWTMPGERSGLRGQRKYEAMIEVCRHHRVWTPEDPFQKIRVGGSDFVVALLFLLYDYSFKPTEVPLDKALEWALEHDICCADEVVLHPDPFPSRIDWCHHRCKLSLARLREIPPNERIVLVNHFPLRGDLVFIPRIPRFRIWCGTTETENWHKLFNVEAVVYGHLHFRTTDWRDGVRFEEVSLGYPKQWRPESGVDRYIRKIVPN